MKYDPPEDDDWMRSKRVYDEGFNHAKNGGKFSDCPYDWSNHERDTTLQDYHVMDWEKGFMDYFEE